MAIDDHSIVQRILFPLPGDADALSLYVRADAAFLEWTRTSLTLATGTSASLATYFAAFPAGVWRTHTDVQRVRVSLEISGSVTVRVCAADEQSGRRVIHSRQVDDGAFVAEVPLDAGTWLWLELEDAGNGATIRDGAWSAEPRHIAPLCVTITTHDRPDDCIGVLRRVASDPFVLDHLVRVFVVDQGASRLHAAHGFDEVDAALGERLRVIEQANLGGSGGFSRGMIESLKEEAANVLLLDDDVILEPESILRLAAFSAHTLTPTIVGAHMLSLLDRTLLHTFGERVEQRGFRWRPVDETLAPVDLAIATIESTPALRRVPDVDFNGWWMCLVPTASVRDVGASLPMFIKWDDTEFGLRAAAAGIRTVTLPGAALWHVPWTGKDDGLDWQAYYQLRNRVVTALLHSRSRRGGGILASSFALDVNHVLCLQYGSAAVRRLALRDVLRGPAHLPATIVRRTADSRALLARAGQVVVAADRLPLPVGGVASPQPLGALRTAARLLKVVAHQTARPRPAGDQVEVALDRSQGKWWAVGLLDSATVDSATGKGAFVGRRNRTIALALVRDAVWLRMRLWMAWPRLAQAYAHAAPDLASAESWERLFAANPTSTPITHST